MIFIRHAEPDKDGNLTERGRLSCKGISLPETTMIYHSELTRSIDTAELLPLGETILFMHRGLNEWDKSTETADQFKNRVRRTLREIPDDAVVVGHSRWMTWAHWILKGEVALGFDYLESFEA